jgi:hypothetical protein
MRLILQTQFGLEQVGVNLARRLNGVKGSRQVGWQRLFHCVSLVDGNLKALEGGLDIFFLSFLLKKLKIN